jgi:hypothetical protein
MLQVLDALETHAQAPGGAEMFAPELTRADTALTATVGALRALAPAAAPERRARVSTEGESALRTLRRPSVSKTSKAREPSTNAYLPPAGAE